MQLLWVRGFFVKAFASIVPELVTQTALVGEEGEEEEYSRE